MQPSMTTPAPPRPHEVGQHHFAEDTTAHVASGIDHDDVAGLGVIQDMAVELSFRVLVFPFAIHIFTFGHELESQSWSNDALAGSPGDGSSDLRIADSEAREFTGGSGAADAGQAVNQVF